jgi:hypothetical protein
MTTTLVERSGSRLNSIIGWQNDQIVDRYARTFGRTQEESLACFEAWKQFMAVSAIRDGGSTVPSGPIDDMWHTALVFTTAYRAFCNDHIGCFIDHNPQEHSDPVGYEATRDTAMELFGELDSNYWTAEAAECGIDCD